MRILHGWELIVNILAERISVRKTAVSFFTENDKIVVRTLTANGILCEI